MTPLGTPFIIIETPPAQAGLDSHPPSPKAPHQPKRVADGTQTRPDSALFSPARFDILLVYRAAVCAYLRLTPIRQGRNKTAVGRPWRKQGLHPDERFLSRGRGYLAMKEVLVDPNNRMAHETGLSSLSDYFNTANPTSPRQQSYTSSVYGTLPICLTRYITEVAFHHRSAGMRCQRRRPLSASRIFW